MNAVSFVRRQNLRRDVLAEDWLTSAGAAVFLLQLAGWKPALQLPRRRRRKRSLLEIAEAEVGARSLPDGARLCPATRDQSQQCDLQPPHAEARAALSSHVAAAGLRHSRAPGAGSAAGLQEVMPPAPPEQKHADLEIGAPGAPLAGSEIGAPLSTINS
ncbi:MAG: hypothetical protein P4N60_09790 [Verrucomicrobiae bacterium]|nr:hypothetical protein [Verrucomicrobiae bacterium]